MGQIKTKAEYYRLAELGLLGNVLPVWRNMTEVAASGYDGLLAVRTSAKIGGAFITNLSWWDAGETYSRLVSEGYNKNDVFFQQMDPGGGRRLLQGCIMSTTDNAIHMEFSCVDKHFREAIKNIYIVKDLSAKIIFLNYGPPEDWEMLIELMAEYPGHVIEFSVFEKSCGDMMRRTIIWEVRDY